MNDPQKGDDLRADGGEGITRRRFLGDGARGALAVGLGASAVALLARRGGGDGLVWQIDPAKCNACGNCAAYCVLEPSAVKCVHVFRMCGYCELCFGFFAPQSTSLDEGAGNQLCPTGAIGRQFVEGPYYEYKIDEGLCVGCGKCVKGCSTFGNGSLFLQVRHDRCVHCNQCSIAAACPAEAFVRVPAARPYLLKGQGPSKGDQR